MIALQRVLLLLAIGCAVTMIWILLSIVRVYVHGFRQGWKGDRDVGD